MAHDINGENPQDRPASPDDATKSSAKKASSTAKKTTSTTASKGRKKIDRAEETVEAVARKAKSTARKVAAVVSDTVKEIAEKVAAKKSRVTKKADSAEGETKTARRAASTTAGSAIRKSTSRTKVGALAGDVTSEDIRNEMQDMPGSIRDEQDIADEAATDVREHFFHDQHVHAGPPPPQAPRDLPDEYGDTKLVLLVRDPEWVYAYWEINDATRQELGIPREGHNGRIVLRLFKITGRQWPGEAAHYFFDVEVSPEARSWYLRLPEPNEVWCAELGMIDTEQNFIPICRSNEFYTPRNSISEHVDTEWMTVEESFEKITRLSSANLEAQLRGDGQMAGSESILKLINRQLTGVLHGERAAMSSGLFSSESLRPVGAKDFWLQVHTELILYGATEPDARVTVQGQPVLLNEDGTFSIRYALPDGEQVLEVRAVNNAGDMEETITPVVRRSTR